MILYKWIPPVRCQADLLACFAHIYPPSPLVGSGLSRRGIDNVRPICQEFY